MNLLNAALIGLLNFLVPIQAADKKSGADSRLETLLQEWEKADKEVRDLHGTFQLTIEDRILKDKKITQGEVFFKKPDVARINLKDQEGKLYQIWLYNCKTIRLYNLTNEIEELGPMELDASLDWLTMWISSLLKSARWASAAAPFEETQKSFHFHLRKEDKYWAYIQLEPRNPQEFVDFKEMEVVLNQKTHLVRQVRWLIANGNRMILDFDKIEINPTPPITWESISKDLPKEFKKPRVPDGLLPLFSPISAERRAGEPQDTLTSGRDRGKKADPLQEAILRQEAIEAKPGWWKKDSGLVLKEIPLGTALETARVVMRTHGFKCSGPYMDSKGTYLSCRAYKRTSWITSDEITVSIYFKEDKVTDCEVEIFYRGP